MNLLNLSIIKIKEETEEAIIFEGTSWGIETDIYLSKHNAQFAIPLDLVEKIAAMPEVQHYYKQQCFGDLPNLKKYDA